MSDMLRVTMFGEFSICYQDCRIDDYSNRMRKVWLLLAFMIYTRTSRVSMSKYQELLWNPSEESGDPSGRLKTLFYRTRTLLSELKTISGHELILYKNGTYQWNTDIPLWLDVEEFEHLCGQASSVSQKEERLDLYLQALALYQGDFLSKLSAELWVMPLSAYYHQMFLDALEQALPLLEAEKRWKEAADLCVRSLKIEPYSEALHQHYMRCLIAMGDRTAAITAYEEMSKLLLDCYGTFPSEESHQLFQDASRESHDYAISLTALQNQLQDTTNTRGALYCEYSFFKLLYQVQSRSLLREKKEIQIALLTLQGEDSLSRSSLNLAVDHLKNMITGSLRRGDVVTSCSASQLLIMLPQASTDNGIAVCKRILRAFYHQYPHSPVKISYVVQPLKPPEVNHTTKEADPL